jgi:hypothetical protein
VSNYDLVQEEADREENLRVLVPFKGFSKYEVKEK